MLTGQFSFCCHSVSSFLQQMAQPYNIAASLPSSFPFTATPHTLREASPAVCRTVPTGFHGTSAKEVIQDHSTKVRHDEIAIADAQSSFHEAHEQRQTHRRGVVLTAANASLPTRSHCNILFTAYSVPSPFVISQSLPLIPLRFQSFLPLCPVASDIVCKVGGFCLHPQNWP